MLLFLWGGMFYLLDAIHCCSGEMVGLCLRWFVVLGVEVGRELERERIRSCNM